MLKWVLTLTVAVFLLGIAMPHLARFIRFGHLPGDLHFRFRGRQYVFPWASTLLLSVLFWIVSRIV